MIILFFVLRLFPSSFTPFLRTGFRASRSRFEARQHLERGELTRLRSPNHNQPLIEALGFLVFFLVFSFFPLFLSQTKAALESAHSEASTVLRSIASTLLERSKHVKSPETQTAHFEACKTFSSAWSAAAGAAHERNGAESESESERLVKSALNRIAEEQARAMAGLAEGIRRRVK